MTKTSINTKEVELKNNCPECYNSKGLYLIFSQKFIETVFYKCISSNINHQIKCKICNTIIYPERWTDDIERVFEYHKKVHIPKNASTKLKNASWLIIIFAITIITAILILIYK